MLDLIVVKMTELTLKSFCSIQQGDLLNNSATSELCRMRRGQKLLSHLSISWFTSRGKSSLTFFLNTKRQEDASVSDINRKKQIHLKLYPLEIFVTFALCTRFDKTNCNCDRIPYMNRIETFSWTRLTIYRKR